MRKRLLRDLEAVRAPRAGRGDLAPSRRLPAEAALEMISGDLRALAQAAEACERRVQEGEKVAAEEKIISLSDADAAFIVKGSWNSVVGYRPQLARSGRGFVSALVLPVGNAADSPQLVRMVNEHISNTGVTPWLVASMMAIAAGTGGRECSLSVWLW